MKAIHEVQQKGNFKNLLLEKKLGALADTLEKKVIIFLDFIFIMCVCVCVFVCLYAFHCQQNIVK